MNKLAIFAVLLALVGCDYKPKVEPEPINAVACKIETLFGSGSGILLNTGFILTAGHVIDADRNNKLDEPEEDVDLIFYNPNIRYEGSQRISGKVLAMINTKEADVAIILPESPTPYKSSIKLISDQEYAKTKFGDRVYTVGAPLDWPLHRTDGRITSPNVPYLERTSITILAGNSGGGVFDQNRNCLGVMKTGLMRHHRLKIPTLNGVKVFRFSEYIANSANYVPAPRIRMWAKANKLTYAIDAPAKPSIKRPIFTSDTLMYLTLGFLVLQVILIIWSKNKPKTVLPRVS